jgi:hypothetical protein
MRFERKSVKRPHHQVALYSAAGIHRPYVSPAPTSSIVVTGKYRETPYPYCDCCPAILAMRRANAEHAKVLRGVTNPYSALHDHPWMGAGGRIALFDDVIRQGRTIPCVPSPTPTAPPLATSAC